MRTLTFWIVLLFSSLTVASGYYHLTIDEYDPESGFYYKGIENSKKPGLLSRDGNATKNIYIYNPKTGEGKLLFPTQGNVQIVALLYETAVQNGRVDFNNTSAVPIKNNNGIESRAPKNSMLVVARTMESKKVTIFLIDKDGSKVREMTSLDESYEWHVDVKNSLVRLVRQVNNNIELQAFAW